MVRPARPGRALAPFVVLLSLGLPSVGVAQAPRASALGDLSSSFESLAASVSPAVVQIFASGRAIRRDGTSGQGVIATQRANGSGVIIDPAGYIITNQHVVAGATELRVSIAEQVASAPGRSILKPQNALVPARLIGADPETDLAVLRIERENLPFVPFGDSDELEQGQLVFAFGSPLGLENSVSMGVVSAVARQLEPESPMIYIQTDAAVNPGNSGGALVDTEGRLVGINTLILSQSGGSEGLGFAAPVNIVKSVFEQIVRDGRVRRGSIGVRTQTITPALAEGLDLARSWGVILSDVRPGGPASQAGLQVGDVVLRLDGKLMENARQFDVNLYRYGPGSRITVEVMRGVEPLAVQVTVGERLDFPDPLAAALASDRNLVPELGIFGVDLGRVAPLIPRARSSRGVVVAALTQGPQGVQSPFQSGDILYSVNNELIADIAGLRTLLGGFARGDALVFHVQRSGQMVYVTASADW